MTQKLDPKVKKERAEKRKTEEDRVKRNELTALLNQHGNAKKVAEVLGVTSSTIYERMARLKIETNYGFIENEPKDPKERKKWLEGLLKKHNNDIQKIASELKLSATSVRTRITKLGITLTKNNHQAKIIIKALLNEYKTIEKAAEASNNTVEEFKEKMKQAGVNYSKK
jgi:DNA-binding NtrC family response regulator